MEKKYRPGYKTLLTSLTIATILTNARMQNVHATEGNVYNEVVTEEAVEQTVPLVEEAPEEAVEQTVPLVEEAEVDSLNEGAIEWTVKQGPGHENEKENVPSATGVEESPELADDRQVEDSETLESIQETQDFVENIMYEKVLFSDDEINYEVIEKETHFDGPSFLRVVGDSEDGKTHAYEHTAMPYSGYGWTTITAYVNGIEVFQELGGAFYYDGGGMGELAVGENAEIKHKIEEYVLYKEPMTIEYRYNPELSPWESRVIQEGGYRTKTGKFLVTYVDGYATDPVQISSEIIDGEFRIIETGSEINYSNRDIEEIIIPYETKYVKLDTLEFGEETVLVHGKNGKKTVDSTRTYINGYPVYEYYSEVIEDISPITEIIATGTKVVENPVEIEILGVTLDKEVYRPGEEVEVTIEVSHVVGLDSAEIVFGNTVSMDAEFLEIINFEKDPNTGNLIGRGSYTISEFPAGFEADFYIFKITSYVKNEEPITIRYDYTNPDPQSPLHNVGFELLNPIIEKEELEVLEVRLDKDVYRPEDTPQLTVVVSGESDIDYVSLWFAMKESGGWPDVVVDNFKIDQETGNYVGTTTLDLSYYAFGYTEPFHPFFINVYDKSGNVTEIRNDYDSPETINPLLDATFTIDYTEEEPNDSEKGPEFISISVSKEEYLQGEPINITVTMSSEIAEDYPMGYVELYFDPEIITGGNPAVDPKGVYFDSSLFEINEDGFYEATMSIRVFDEIGKYKLVSGLAYDVYGNETNVMAEEFLTEFNVTESSDDTWPETFEDLYSGTGITASIKNMNRSDIQMIASDVTNDVQEIPKELGSNHSLYDISFIENWYGYKVDLDLPVTITIPYLSTLVPEKVYYFGEDFEIIEEIDFIDNGDSITFVSDTFSYFGIQFAETDTPGGGTDVPSRTDTPSETETPSVTVESTDVDLPPTGVASTAITSILGALFLSIGSALGFRKKKK